MLLYSLHPVLPIPRFLIVGNILDICGGCSFCISFLAQQHLLQEGSPKDGGFHGNSQSFLHNLLWSFLPSYLSSCCSFQDHPHHCLLSHYTITFYPGHPFTPFLFDALDYPSWNLSGSNHHPLHCMQGISFDMPLQKLKTKYICSTP